MTRSSVFISTYPLALDAVSLGCIVSFVKDPSHDSFNPSTELPEKPQVSSSTSKINNIINILNVANAAGLELTLTSFANAFLKGEHKDVRQLTTKQGAQYLLLGADNWFERICQSNLTQSWLERAAGRGRKAYLVTGIRTLKDVEFSIDKSQEVDVGAGAQPPTLAAAGAPLPSPLDVGAQADLSVKRSWETSGDIPEEKIYGVQYREIRLRKVFSTSLAPNLTAKIFWERIFTDRDASNAELDEDEDEMIEAHLLENIEETEDLSTIPLGPGQESYVYAR